jgi:hypothetical protein
MDRGKPENKRSERNLFRLFSVSYRELRKLLFG